MPPAFDSSFSSPGSRESSVARRSLGRSALGIASAVVLCVTLLELLAFAFGTPKISAVARALGGMWADGVIAQDIAVTSTRWLVGWISGAVLGLSVGVWTGRSIIARIGLERFLTLLRAIPVICLVPLSIRFFGLDEVGKYFVVGWAVFFVCWLGAHQASASLPEEAVWRARSLRLSWRDWLRAVLFPHIAPAAYVALRTSLLLGLIVTAVAELAGVYQRDSGEFWSEGLGYRIFRTLDQARDDQLFGAILTFSLLGVVAEAVFKAVWSWSSRALLNHRVSETRKDLAGLVSRERVSQDTSEILPPVISVINLTASYRGRSSPVLRNFTFEIASGSTVALLGRSGAGKTTLLRAISGFSIEDMMISGSVSFAGKAADEMRIGVIAQDAPVFDALTSWQNVRLGDRLRFGSISTLVSAIDTMKEFGLGLSLDMVAEKLSGGQMQRLAFATAVLNEPQVLLCDEPFSSLDPFTRRVLQSFYVHNIRTRRSMSTLWITHDVDEALIVADKIYVIRADQLIPLDLSVYRQASAEDEWLQSADFLRARQDIIDLIVNAHE